MIRANYDIAPLFQPGELVRHRRYGYRGVVVDYDLICQASDDWYQANQTQPERNQPWYHVLVDQTGTTTYSAESKEDLSTVGDWVLISDPDNGSQARIDPKALRVNNLPVILSQQA